MSGYGDDYKDQQAVKLVKNWCPDFAEDLGFWQKAQIAEAYRDASRLRELKRTRSLLRDAEKDAFND